MSFNNKDKTLAQCLSQYTVTGGSQESSHVTVFYFPDTDN